jgi:3'-phosphoadenosine 5'-phosphosulfate sulfotransferase (PAPS reductase)/FAD synthetase
MQGWDLQRKVRVTQTRILEWYERNNGKVYISFSGGKDSTVLLDIARRMYPNIEAVFCDTGLEYPEVRAFAMSKENITLINPLKYDRKKRAYIPTNFMEVCKTYGYPIIAKEVAQTLYWAQKGQKTALLKMNGLDKNGNPSKFRERFLKYRYLMDAPFYISHKCCDAMKKIPATEYEKRTGKAPIIATMAAESQLREQKWLENGCNAFDVKRPKSTPISFWTEQDVLKYLKMTGIHYASVYGDIVPQDNQLKLFENDSDRLCTTGCDRTGCMFCCFGIMHDPELNRFKRMKTTHPQRYEYCIGGGAYDGNGMLKPDRHGLGIGKVLDYIGVQYY